MKNSYQQYFKKAKEVRTGESPKKSPRAPKKKLQIKLNKKTRVSKTSTEDLFREAFMLNKKKHKKKKGLSTPWKTLGVLGLLTLFTGWGFVDPGGIESLLSKVEIGIMPKGLTAGKQGSATANSASAKVKKGEKNSYNKDQSENNSKINKKNTTNEDLSYFSKLGDRKKELDGREQELEKLEEELHKQRVEIEKRIIELKKVRDQISGTLNKKVQVDQEKVMKLVGFYSSMKPKKAAKLIGSIDENLAVEILGQMKKKNAAEVMNLLEPKKAQILSEKFAGYKRR